MDWTEPLDHGGSSTAIAAPSRYDPLFLSLAFQITSIVVKYSQANCISKAPVRTSGAAPKPSQRSDAQRTNVSLSAGGAVEAGKRNRVPQAEGRASKWIRAPHSVCHPCGRTVGSKTNLNLRLKSGGNLSLCRGITDGSRTAAVPRFLRMPCPPKHVYLSLSRVFVQTWVLAL